MNRKLTLSFLITALIFSKTTLCMNASNSDILTSQFANLIQSNRLEHFAMHFIILNKVDLNYKDSNGANLLILAAKHNRIFIARLIMEEFLKTIKCKSKDCWDYFAFINATDNDNKTALMFAVFNNNIDFVKLLLNHGADDEVKNNDGKTAIDLAKENGLTEIVNLLENEPSFVIQDDSLQIQEDNQEDNNDGYGTTDEENNNNVEEIGAAPEKEEFFSVELYSDNEVLSESDQISTAVNLDKSSEKQNFIESSKKADIKSNSNSKHKISIRKSGDKLYFCDYCDYSTKYTSTFKRHQYVHTGDKPYKCPYAGCSYSTTRNYRLVEHKRARKHNIK